jgi:hypothetical protein
MMNIELKVTQAEVGHGAGKMELEGAEWGLAMAKMSSAKFPENWSSEKKAYSSFSVVFRYPIWIETMWSCAFNVLTPESSSVVSLQILRFLVFCAHEDRTCPGLPSFLSCIHSRIAFFIFKNKVLLVECPSQVHSATFSEMRFLNFPKFTTESGRPVSSPFPLCLGFS